MSNSNLVVLINGYSKPLNAANTGAGVTNPDGTTNVSGTVIGVAQTTHSAVDFGGACAIALFNAQ